MDESQVRPEAYEVNGTLRNPEGADEVAEYSASVKALANLISDAAMNGGMVHNVVRDFAVLLNSLGLRGRKIEGAEFDTVPEGIEVVGSAGRTLGFLSEALNLRESVDEGEAWALSETLTSLAQGIDAWALGWCGNVEAVPHV